MEAANAELDISVIIPVWNGAGGIGKALSAIRDQTALREKYEVIVVDNGSTDNTVAIVKMFDGITLLQEPAAGGYRARNRGIAHARGRFLLFTDDDCIPEPDWIEKALQHSHRYGEQALVGGAVRLFKEGQGSDTLFLYEQSTAFRQEWNLAHEGCVTANWLSSKALLNRVGGFDEGLLSGGDFECAGRIAAIGGRLVYAPDLVVNHPSRARLYEIIRKRRRTLGGHWRKSPKERRFLNVAKILIKRAVHEIIDLIDPKINPTHNYLVLCIPVVILATNAYEVLRLMLGFAPLRR